LFVQRPDSLSSALIHGHTRKFDPANSNKEADMIKRHTKLLGASAILIGLSAPFTIQAHENDNTWLYVAGAVATYAHFSDNAYNHRDHRYSDKRWRKHVRKARRHDRRAHRHDRQMHRGHDRYSHDRYSHNRYDKHGKNARHNGHDKHALRSGARNDRRQDGRRSDGRHS
jgi:hypothetical protein